MSSAIDRRLSTGVTGLDEVLHGGLLAGRSYLVRGPPGAGKTVLGYEFLTADPDADALFINLEESEGNARVNAESLGFDLSAVTFLDLSPESDFFADDQSYSVFEPEEVEQESLTDRIVEEVRTREPDRVFLDPVTQFRNLTSDEYQFRKQVLSFMRFLTESDATVLFTSQRTPTTPDDDLQFLSDGIVELEQTDYGRTITVPKFRGSDRREGTHAARITDGGMAVYPQLVPEEHGAEVATETIGSGVEGLDSLLGGGIERGTITIISGPTGVGKTTTATLFAQAAAQRGDRAAIYMFEESTTTFSRRSTALGIPIEDLQAAGTLHVQEIEPLARSAEEFAHMVRQQVEQQDTDIVVIDGVNGYKLSIQGDEKTLVRKLHALGRYLKNMGVTVVMVDEVDTVTGDFEATNVGISYLADNVLFLRHIELDGELRKVLGVLKKRVSDFESTLREFKLADGEVSVGEPLTDVRGILQGTPERVGGGGE
ncbi:MAG: ATPase domain-containing protein [Halapricum sp.]